MIPSRPLIASCALTAILALSCAAGCAALTGSDSDDTAQTEQPEQQPPPQQDDQPSAFDRLAAEAQEAYRQRGEVQQARRAAQLWREAIEEAGDELADDELAEAYTRLARSHYFIARYHRADTALIDVSVDLGASLEEGLAAAERAVELAAPRFRRAVERGAPFEAELPDPPAEATEQLLWYAKHLDLLTNTTGVATDEELRPVADAAMRHVAEHDPEAHFGAAHRYFGVEKTTRLMNRDEEGAREALDESLEIAPNFLINELLYSLHVTLPDGDRDNFEAQLESIAESDGELLAEATPENEFARQWAERLLERTDELFDTEPAPTASLR